MSTTSSSVSAALPSVAVVFLIWAFLFYIARLWTKLGKNDPWGADGTVISLAMLTSVAHVICVYYAWHRGYGDGWFLESTEENRSAIEKSLYAGQIFYLASIGFTRSSTALFTARILTLGEQRRRSVSAMIAFCGLCIPVSILVVAIRSPVSSPWKALDGSQEMFVRWVAVEVIGLVIDSGTLAFSIAIIWGLQMSVWRRITICMLFGVRLLAIPVVACRLAQLHPTFGTLSTAYNKAGSLLTEAELQLILILASATCLKPLFQPFHPGFFAAETNTNLAVTGYTHRTGGSNSGRQAYYELSGSVGRGDKDRKLPKSRTTVNDDASDEVDLVQPHRRNSRVAAMRPDEGESWSEAIAGSSPAAGSDKHHIEATRTWAVSYEKRDPAGY